MKKRYFLVILILLASCAIALADEDVPPPMLISENPDFSIVDWYRSVMPFDDELTLVRLTSSISKSDSTHVSIHAVTQANKNGYPIGGSMVVQQWKDNKWNNYYTTTYSERGTSRITADDRVTVASGYYYRLVVEHAVHYFSEHAYETRMTSSIFVN